MALIVEDGTTVANSNSYDTAANANAYYVDMGYVGSFTESSGALVNGAVAAAATSMAIDTGDASAVALKGDKFTVAAVAGEYEFTETATSNGSGAIAAIAFSPAAPAGGFPDDSALTFTGGRATDQEMIRGSRVLDRRFQSSLKGIRTESGQSMLWPRRNVTDDDGNVVASDTIPTTWKHAAYEMARAVNTDVAVDKAQRIRSAGAGSARVEFASALEVDTVVDYVDMLVSAYVQHSNRRVRA